LATSATKFSLASLKTALPALENAYVIVTVGAVYPLPPFTIVKPVAEISIGPEGSGLFA